MSKIDVELENLRLRVTQLYAKDFLTPEIVKGYSEIECGDDVTFAPIGTKITDIAADFEWIVTDYPDGFIARLSANGFLDCTEWEAFPTEREALTWLVDTKEEMDWED